MCKVEVAARLKLHITNLCLQQIFTVKLSKAYHLNMDSLGFFHCSHTNVRISGRGWRWWVYCVEILLNSQDLLLCSLVFNSLIAEITSYTGHSKLELVCLGCAHIKPSHWLFTK